MALIIINSVAIPTPSDYSVGIQDISKGERNANGSMIIERITTKRKIELSWKYLTKTDLKTILDAVSDVFFEVGYEDPEDGTTKTGTFYCGDRVSPMQSYINNIPVYKDLKFNIVER